MFTRKLFEPRTVVIILTFSVISSSLLNISGYRVAVAAESYSLIKQWGSRGSGNGQFALPWSLALDSSNNVYVSDLNNQRIQKFDAAGNFITLWSIGGYNYATGVATDTSNNVYVYHVYAQSSPISQVEKYTSNGDLIKSWGVPNPPGPNVNDVQTAIAVDSSNNVYASNNDTIFKFTSDGTFIKSWGSSGKRIGQFNQIVGLATDSLNNVYVTDKYNGRVEKFTSDGDFIKAWNCCNAEPQGIATDKSNNVYVTVYNDGGIFKFTSDGDFVTSWAAPSAYGVAIDPSGKVYVSSGLDNIQVYAPTSSPPQTRITSAADANGNAVQSGGSTVSTSITFQVTATPGTPIAGFQCSLDGSSFSSCASMSPATISYNNLAVGQHTFKVRAVDTQGNVDTTPASFTWTILTPTQATHAQLHVGTNTQQKQECKTAGGTSPISGSCTATSNDWISQSAGIYHSRSSPSLRSAPVTLSLF